jgi:hypothetical protein
MTALFILSFITKNGCIKVWVIKHQVKYILYENVRYFSLAYIDRRSIADSRVRVLLSLE